MMGRQNGTSMQPRGVLESVITYLCFKVTPCASHSRLMKLVYLADVYHYVTFGSRLTSVPFKHYDFGAFAADVYWCLDSLTERGILSEESVETKEGYTATIMKPSVKKTWVDLPDDAFASLDRAIKRWGSRPLRSLIEFTKETIPFKGTPYDEEIEFSSLDVLIEDSGLLEGSDVEKKLRDYAVSATTEAARKRLRERLKEGYLVGTKEDIEICKEFEFADSEMVEQYDDPSGGEWS